MNVAIVLLILLTVLFALTFFTKRRFGVLGLALTAGATLSGLWTPDVVPIVQQAGVELVAPPLSSVVAAAIILLPAVVLLFSGPTYSSKLQRAIGSLVFSLLALAFMLEPLEGALVLEGDGKRLFDILVEYRVWIITAGILLALADLLFVKTPKISKEKH